MAIGFEGKTTGSDPVGSVVARRGFDLARPVTAATATAPLPAAAVRPALTSILNSSMLADDRAPLPFDAHRGSTSELLALNTLIRRSFRTLSPFVMSDVVALVACAWIAQAVVGLVLPHAVAVPSWLPLLSLSPLMIGYWLSGIYCEIWVHPAIEFKQLTVVSTVALVAAAGAGLLAPPVALWAAAAWLAAIVIVPLLRTVVRACCENRRWWGYPTLIIGTGDAADEVAHLVLECPRSGLRPVLLTDPHGHCRASRLRVVNDPAALESIIRNEGIRHAVVSLPEFSVTRLSMLLDRYSNLVPHLLVLSDASTLPTLWAASRSGGRLSGIEVRNGLLMSTLQGLKRFIDLFVAVVSFIIGLPLLIFIALLIKLTSRGPVLFGHVRIGLHGRPFKAWKFRTMHVNGDAILRDYLERVTSARVEWEREQKLRHDPRVTAVGRILRRTSLDELPQIWNVLRGDMSIVGPRPIVESEVPRYADVFRLYTRLKPGITGLWQVSGRSNVGYEDRVRLDQFYVRHWSPWLDIYILAKTVVALLRREGAY